MQGAFCLARIPGCWTLAGLNGLLVICKVVALHLYSNTANAYLCNQCGTVSLFLSRLASHILNLANKHGITLIPAFIPIPLSVEADYLSWVNKRWISWHPHTPVNVSATCGSLGVE